MKGEFWETPHWKGDVDTTRQMIQVISACLPLARTSGTRLLDRRGLQSFPRMRSGWRELHQCSTGVPWGPTAVPPRLSFDHRIWAPGEEMHEVSSNDPGHACPVGERALLIVYHWLDQPLKPCPQRKRLQSCPEFSTVPVHTFPTGCPLQGSPEVWVPDLRCLAGVSNPTKIPVSHDVLALGALMYFKGWLFSSHSLGSCCWHFSSYFLGGG